MTIQLWQGRVVIEDLHSVTIRLRAFLRAFNLKVTLQPLFERMLSRTLAAGRAGGGGERRHHVPLRVHGTAAQDHPGLPARGFSA